MNILLEAEDALVLCSVMAICSEGTCHVAVRWWRLWGKKEFPKWGKDTPGLCQGACSEDLVKLIGLFLCATRRLGKEYLRAIWSMVWNGVVCGGTIQALTSKLGIDAFVHQKSQRGCHHWCHIRVFLSHTEIWCKVPPPYSTSLNNYIFSLWNTSNPLPSITNMANHHECFS